MSGSAGEVPCASCRASVDAHRVLMPTVTELYHQTLSERGFQADAAQLTAVAALPRGEDEWVPYRPRRPTAPTKMLVRPPIPRGVYMYGGVGRGKSFLMDCF